MANDPRDGRAIVRRLAPEALHRLIRHAGLERGVLTMEALSRDQQAGLLDLDLWTAAVPGRDEHFDEDRFGEWVEALVERDAAAAARVVSGWDRSLVVTGLSRFVRVFDPGVLEPVAQTDDERPEPRVFASDGSTAEIGGYVVRARRDDAWDAIVELLLELSAGHAECFHAVMIGCKRVSDGGREVDGLDDLLEAPEQLQHDVSVDRDTRRAAKGFSAAADARAFLAAARGARRSSNREAPVTDGVLSSSRALVASAGGRGLRPFIEHLKEGDPDLALARIGELAFLANTLVAGCELLSRSFTPAEASAAAFHTCSLGLRRGPAPVGIDYLVGHDLVAVFNDGWAALHREVSMFVAEELLALIRHVRTGDSDTAADLHALRHSLETQLVARTPWRAREDLGVLAVLDTPAWSGLVGLLGECPVIPDAVTAIVERRSSAIDPNAFAFIASDADLEMVRAFMARMPDLLAG